MAQTLTAKVVDSIEVQLSNDADGSALKRLAELNLAIEARRIEVGRVRERALEVKSTGGVNAKC